MLGFFAEVSGWKRRPSAGTSSVWRYPLLPDDDDSHHREDYPANQVAGPEGLAIFLGISRLQGIGHCLLQDLSSQVSVVRQKGDSEQREHTAKDDSERTSHSDDSVADRAVTLPGCESAGD
jgi:hypothetical protein